MYSVEIQAVPRVITHGDLDQAIKNSVGGSVADEIYFDAAADTHQRGGQLRYFCKIVKL